MAVSAQTKILVVGGGMAAHRLAIELSDCGQERDITILSGEPQFGYNRVLLPNLIAGRCSERELASSACAVQIVYEAATSIDVHQRTVATTAGALLNYDVLVLATGGVGNVPDPLTIEHPRVQTLRNLADAAQLMKSTEAADRIAVIGGGLLGVEAAAALSDLGIATTLVHRASSLLNRNLDGDASERLAEHLRARGIELKLACQVTSASAGADTRWMLSDGSELLADTLLVAAGVTSDDRLAREAGLTCDHGVVVDSSLQTSDPSVFALGECARVDGKVFTLVDAVNRQARALASTLSGQPAPFEPPLESTRLKVHGLELFSVGDTDAHTETATVEDQSGDLYRRLFFDGPTLIGAVLMGDSQGAIALQQAIGKPFPSTHQRRALVHAG